MKPIFSSFCTFIILLFGLTESVGAVSAWSVETASGNFGANRVFDTSWDSPQTQELHQDELPPERFTVSDVRDGPNVYTYVTQNPWSFFDPLGLNEVIVGGGPSNSENDPMKFIRSAEKETIKAQSRIGKDEKVEWLIDNKGYQTRAAKDGEHYMHYTNEIKDRAKKLGVKLTWYWGEKDLAYKINNSAMGVSRENESKISRLTFFGHGAPGKLWLNTGSRGDYGADGKVLDRADLKSGMINANAFRKKSVCVSWACNTGTRSSKGDNAEYWKNPGNENSFTQEWENATGLPMHGVIGKTDYAPVTPTTMQSWRGIYSAGVPTMGYQRNRVPGIPKNGPHPSSVWAQPHGAPPE